MPLESHPKPAQKPIDFSQEKTISSIVKRALQYTQISHGYALDLGSGVGRNSFFLAEEGYSVVAVDQDCNVLRKLAQEAHRRELLIETVCTDMTSYNADADRFNLVISINTLHFLPRTDVSKVIALMKSSTAIGGIHAVSVQTTHNKPNKVKRLFDEGELKSYYSDWEILHYSEDWGTPFRLAPQGPVFTKHRAEIIARRRAK
ncbi:MAG: methyltransferase domain-containing protein [Patescibacteria group bacterium]